MSGSVALSDGTIPAIDYSPFLRRLRPGETIAFTRRARRERTPYSPIPGPGLSDVLSALGALVMTIPLVVIEVVLLGGTLLSIGPLLLTAVVGIVSIAATVGCLFVIWRDQPLFPLIDELWRRRLRIAEFARVNAFDHLTESTAPFSPLDPQAVPGTQIATDRLILRHGPALEIGNLRYHVHSWQHVAEIHIGYLAVARPPAISPAMLETLQRSVDHAGLGVQVTETDDWIILQSHSAFDLTAPQTYRILFWIAAQTDPRRGDPQPISAEGFIAESKRLARLRDTWPVGRFFLGAVAASALWLIALLAWRLGS